MNLSFLLIREQEYAEALRIIEQASEVFKEYSMYKHLAAAYVRKGICLSQLTKSKGKEEADKGILMLELLEDYTLRDILIGEIQKHGKLEQ